MEGWNGFEWSGKGVEWRGGGLEWSGVEKGKILVNPKEDYFSSKRSKICSQVLSELTLIKRKMQYTPI